MIQPKFLGLLGALLAAPLTAFAGTCPSTNVIDDPDEVQIYETVLQDRDGGLTFTLLRAASYLKKNQGRPIRVGLHWPSNRSGADD